MTVIGSIYFPGKMVDANRPKTNQPTDRPTDRLICGLIFKREEAESDHFPFPQLFDAKQVLMEKLAGGFFLSIFEMVETFLFFFFF